jgi:hypothetical protein
MVGTATPAATAHHHRTNMHRQCNVPVTCRTIGEHSLIHGYSHEYPLFLVKKITY